MISSLEGDNLIESCFRYCKGAKFRENSEESDNYLKLNLMRNYTSQLASLSYLLSDNEVTCQFLNENLKKYSNLIDSTDGVNNYSEPIQGLVKFVKNVQCQQWKSSLHVNFNDKFQEFLQSLSARDCQNLGCGMEKEITEKDIDLLYRSADVVHSEVSANTLTSVSRQGCQNKETVSHNSHSHVSEKRKNNFLTEHHKNVLKNRRIEDDECINKTLTSDKEVTSVVGNNSKTLPQEQGSCKAYLSTFLKFRTASAELEAQNVKKHGAGRGRTNESTNDNLQLKKSLGSRPRSVTSKFVTPLKSGNKNNQMPYEQENVEVNSNSQEEIDPRLQHIEHKMVEMIRSEIIDSTNPLTWDDIAGLQFAKNTIKEIVVWPMLRPDIFTGLRRPPKGILLFGPPGTGKTLIAKCIASQSKSTFFSISASSLTSKWIGDGEKMVRALFAVARVDQPSVIFIDEIDSLLSKRNDTEHESSRRIKTEFLVQLDGAATGEEDRLLIIGATNRPQELDEAARRRLVKRLYIPLPDHKARVEMVTRLISKEKNSLTAEEIKYVADMTDGYSGADMKILCQEAALGPIRSISYSQIECISSEEVRAVTIDDFKAALERVRSSVSPADLQCYTDWDKTYGSGSI